MLSHVRQKVNDIRVQSKEKRKPIPTDQNEQSYHEPILLRPKAATELVRRLTSEEMERPPFEKAASSIGRQENSCLIVSYRTTLLQLKEICRANEKENIGIEIKVP